MNVDGRERGREGERESRRMSQARGGGGKRRGCVNYMKSTDLSLRGVSV